MASSVFFNSAFPLSFTEFTHEVTDKNFSSNNSSSLSLGLLQPLIDSSFCWQPCQAYATGCFPDEMDNDNSNARLTQS
jgi:hypothetical protein